MELTEIIDIGVNALKQAYIAQRKLFQDGTIGTLVSVGRGEDKATQGDYESEEAVINYLKQASFPGIIIAEEHGEIYLGNNYLAILDGIDGSSALVKNPRTRCGTILTITDKLNPNYNDFIFSGITEYITNRICYGVKGKGVYLIELDKNETTKLQKFQEKPFSPDCIIKIDCYKTDYAPGITKGIDTFKQFMNENVAKYLEGKMQLTGSVTGSEMCFDLLLGYIDAVAHIVAKGVFEPPNMYLLTKELGGFASDLQGNDLGNREWKPMTVYKDGTMEVDGAIFSSSQEIGKSITDLLESN